MPRPTLDISIVLNANAPINNIVITDNTDYDALGIDPNNIAITVQVHTPIGLLYMPDYYDTPEDTADFNPSAPWSYMDDVDSPLTSFLLDSKGCFVDGTYKVKLKWYNSDTEETHEFTFEEKVKFTAPKIKIEQFSDCFCPKFRSTDLTDYGDSTEVDYEHKINYPAETDEADIVSTLLDYTDSRLANGVYVTEIATDRVFPAVGVFSVQKTIKGKKSHTVDCSSICDIKCGINSLYNQYKAACGKSKAESDRLFKMLNEATLLYSLLYMNSGCGDTQKADSYLSKLKQVIGDCDCGCKDCEEDIWVTGACSSSGGSEYDPTPVYNYIDNINTNLTNLINSFEGDITNIENAISQLQNASWFTGLTTTCLIGFPSVGSETAKKQFLIDLLCDLVDATSQPPVARNDYSTIVQDTTIQKLLTDNDFFQTDAEVTITTPPINGTATVLGDDKTVEYTPNPGWTGTEIIGYTLTDANGNTATANWVIIVNAIVAVSCTTVVPAYNVSIGTVGNFLQLGIQNLTAYGTNVPLTLSYLIEIRDVDNNIIESYSVTGDVDVNPTIWTSPDPLANTWDNVRIVMTTSSESSTSAACGTVTYESDTPYTLNYVAPSWFFGTEPCEDLDIDVTDTELINKQKLLDYICGLGAGLQVLNDTVAAIDPDAYVSISDDIIVDASFPRPPSIINAREYQDGRVGIVVFLQVSAPTTIPINTEIIEGLPAREGGASNLILATITDFSAGIYSEVYLYWSSVLGKVINTQGAISLDTNDEITFYLNYNKLT